MLDWEKQHEICLKVDISAIANSDKLTLCQQYQLLIDSSMVINARMNHRTRERADNMSTKEVLQGLINDCELEIREELERIAIIRAEQTRYKMALGVLDVSPQTPTSEFYKD